MAEVTIGSIMAAVERWYPIELADEWDQIGLSVGDPAAPVSSILLTVDITDAVLNQAKHLGANLIIAHHPLDLVEVPGIVTQQHIARMINFAATSKIALYSAHTNADNAPAGVSDAIMNALGAVVTGSISDPTNLIGTGRVGYFEQPIQLRELATRIAEMLPSNAAGVKFAGDNNQPISRIAVCGGSGAGLLPQVAQLDVDAYLTADLKHHAALDHLANSSIALINVSHWASEWLWLATLAAKLNQEFPMISTVVSEICTDPWRGQITTDETR